MERNYDEEQFKYFITKYKWTYANHTNEYRKRFQNFKVIIYIYFTMLKCMLIIYYYAIISYLVLRYNIYYSDFNLILINIIYIVIVPNILHFRVMHNFKWSSLYNYFLITFFNSVHVYTC